MDIAIIGAGNVGNALAAAFVRGGHTVSIASRDPEDAGTVAAATGARAAMTPVEVARSADAMAPIPELWQAANGVGGGVRAQHR